MVYGDHLAFTNSGNTNIVVAIDQASGVVTLSPDANWTGSETITFTATDDSSATATDDVIVTVNNIEDTPYVTTPIPDYVFSEDFTAFDINLNEHFADDDADASLTYSVSNNENDIQASITDSILTLDSILNWNGTTQIVVTADDGVNRLSVSDTFSVTVTPVEDPPYVSNPIEDQNVDEDFEAFTINLNEHFADYDVNDELSYFVSYNDTEVQASISDSILTLDSVTNWNGTTEIVVTADDSQFLITDSLDVVISPVNDEPYFTSLPDTTATEDSPYTYNITTNDVDMGDILSIDSTIMPSWITLTDNGDGTAVLSGTPTNDNVGINPVTLTLTDGNIPNPIEQSFNIVVENSEDAPYIIEAIADTTLDEDFTTFDINLNEHFADDDADASLTYSVSNNENEIQASITNSILTLSAVLNWNGTTELIVTAEDGVNRLSVADTFSVTVTPVNDEPTEVIPIDNIITIEDFSEPFVIDLADHFYDPDSPLEYSVDYTEGEINAVINTHYLTLSPVHNWSGTTVINVFATELTANRATAEITFSVIITPSYDPPMIDVATRTLNFDTTFVGDESEVKEVIIKNIGDTLLVLNTVNAPPGYKLKLPDIDSWAATLSNVNIPENGQTTLQVKLMPTSQIDYNGKIVINSTAVNEPSIEINVSAKTKNATPNAFTPNGDGLNDLFTVKLLNSGNYPISMKIYNMHGRLIKEIAGNSSQPISWDGKDKNGNACPGNPYLYVIQKNGSLTKRGKIYLVK